MTLVTHQRLLSPPSKAEECLPLFEQKRILGSVRERTILRPIRTSMSQTEWTPDYKSVEPCQWAAADNFYEELQKMGDRVSNHVDKILEFQRANIEQKLQGLDEKASKSKSVQESLELRLRELKQRVKKRSEAQACMDGAHIFYQRKTIFRGLS